MVMSSSTDPVGRRATLRPLISKNGSTFSAIQSHFYSHLLHNPKLTSWTQPALCDYGVGKREINRGAAVVSSRWNPTAEQVQALEEMYRRGTRTPSSEQIQQITAKLRRFGKIEGKNVFYWFQNHKARDRQKKRRLLELLDEKNHDIPRTKRSGLSRKYLETEHPKKRPTISKCSTGSKYDGGEVEECKRDRWPQFELQQQSVTANRPLDLSSCCMSPNLSMHKIINQKSPPTQENAHPPLVALDLCKLLSSSNDDVFETGIKEDRTLELFPVRGSGSSTLCSTNKEEMDDDDISSAGTKLVPNQFFEFLPTKN